MRPNSAVIFNKYNPLPSIGQKQQEEIVMGIQREKTFIQETNSLPCNNCQLKSAPKSHFKEPINFNSNGEETINSSFKPLTRIIDLPQEPGDTEENIVLAVKLPDGRRVHQRFRPNETIQLVMNFAESVAKLDFSGCKFVSNTVPKLEFNDLTLNICKSGLEDKSLLYLVTPG